MHIYIVDDDASFARSLALILAERGHSPSTFPTASAFLAVAPDLARGCVLLDLRLPDIHGLDVQTQLAQIADHVVVLLTGFGEVPDAVAAMRAGALDFLTKPFRQQNLVDVLRRAQIRLDDLEKEARKRARVAEAVKLTKREIEVLESLATGQASKIVAHQLGLSVRTIDMHRARIVRKLGVANISSALLAAREAGLI